MKKIILTISVHLLTLIICLSTMLMFIDLYFKTLELILKTKDFNSLSVNDTIIYFIGSSVLMFYLNNFVSSKISDNMIKHLNKLFKL